MTATPESERERMFPLQTSRPPVKPGPLAIPWAIAEEAYAVYAHRYGRDQSLRRLAERGGFGWCEMDDFLPGWRERVDVVNQLRAAIERLAEENAALRERAEALDALEKWLRLSPDGMNGTGHRATINVSISPWLFTCRLEVGDFGHGACVELQRAESVHAAIRAALEQAENAEPRVGSEKEG